jgi:hypothetical protein
MSHGVAYIITLHPAKNLSVFVARLLTPAPPSTRPLLFLLPADADASFRRPPRSYYYCLLATAYCLLLRAYYYYYYYYYY